MTRRRARRSRNGGPTAVNRNRRRPRPHHHPGQLTTSDFPPLQSNHSRTSSGTMAPEIHINTNIAAQDHSDEEFGAQERESDVPDSVHNPHHHHHHHHSPPQDHHSQYINVDSSEPSSQSTGTIVGLRPFPPAGTNTYQLYNQNLPRLVIPRQEDERYGNSRSFYIKHQIGCSRHSHAAGSHATTTTDTNDPDDIRTCPHHSPRTNNSQQPINLVERLYGSLHRPPAAIFQPRSNVRHLNPFRDIYKMGSGIFSIADVGRNQRYYKEREEYELTEADENMRRGLPWYGDFPPPPGPNAMCRKIKKAKQPDPSRWEEEQIPDLGEHIRPDIDVITIDHDYPSRKPGEPKRKAVYDRYRPGHFELWSFSFVFNVPSQRGHYSLRRTDVSDNSPPERPKGYVENELPHFMYSHALAACSTNDDEDDGWFWRIVDVGQGKKRMSFWVVVERERRRFDHYEDELKTRVLKEAMLGVDMFDKGQGAGNADRLGRSNGYTYLGKDFEYERA